jgi:mono/diheme cytochrome c family protein
MEKMKLQLPVLLLVSALATNFGLAEDKPAARKSTDLAAPQPRLAEFREQIAPVLRKTCSRCHGYGKQEGKFRIDTLDPDLLHGKDVDWWLEVFNVISNGEMPPEDAKVKLADADRSKIIEWLSTEIQTASEVRRRQQGHSSFRRMTRYEYNYALQDLLGLPYDFARDLPPEASSDDGFQNSSEILHMTVVQFEMYRRLARKALLRATVRGPRPPVLYWGVSMKDAIAREWPKQLEQVKKLKEKFKDDPARQKREVEQLTASFKKPHNNTYYQELSTGRTARADWAYYGAKYAFAPTDAPSKMPPAGDHVAILPRGKGLVVELGDRVPNEGTMRIRVRAFQATTEAPSLQLEFGWQASNEGRARMRVSTADTLVKGSPEAPGIYQWEIALGDIYPRNSVRNITKMGAMPSPSEYIRLMNSSVSQGDIRLDWVEVSTPVYEKWPPESHTRIFIDSKNRDNEDLYAREVLERFMKRAWRRNVTQAEVDQKFKLYKAIRPECENLEEAVVEVLAAVLSSPNLLYLVRTGGTEEAEQAAKTLRLSNHELATRLSMFLWCSTPDDELLKLAASGKLSNPGDLADQVTRMLADDRSRRFSKHFVRQWLDMQLLDFLSADRKIHPQFDPGLKEAMQREPIAFFQEVLQENESVLNFIDADYTMVNERLARHYGIDGVLGNHFRRVKLDEKMDRGGLLTQAGLLAMNSAGADSHPLKRGIWLLESLLNDPPPPPPPAVPEIDLADPEIAKLTLKERIEDHRNHAACKSCHAKIDPWGIAFENYDAMGRWRNQVQGKPVDATSLLFNNQKLDGMTGLKRFLLENRQDQFARAMVHKMATYALGRPLTFGDYASVNRIAAELRKQEDGLATMVELIVASDLFQSK